MKQVITIIFSDAVANTVTTAVNNFLAGKDPDDLVSVNFSVTATDAGVPTFHAQVVIKSNA